MSDSARQIAHHAPLGAIISWSDGTPRPPARHVCKVRAWKRNNGQGQLVERHPATSFSELMFTLHEGDYGEGGFIILSVRRIFTGSSSLDFEIMSVPEPGSALVITQFGGRDEMHHVASSLDRADAWLPGETARLRAAFDKDPTIDEIAALLGRSRAGVATRIHDLGLRRNSRRSWTDWDDEELAHCYSVEATATLAARLGRGVSALYARAKLLGLSEPGAAPYSGWEDAQLRAGYGKVATCEIAATLRRGLRAVLYRAHHLGLVHGVMRPFSSDEDQAIRSAWAYGVSMFDVAQALGRDPAVIGKHAARIGCRFDDPARPRRGPRTRRASREPVTLETLLALDPLALSMVA